MVESYFNTFRLSSRENIQKALLMQPFKGHLLWTLVSIRPPLRDTRRLEQLHRFWLIFASELTFSLYLPPLISKKPFPILFPLKSKASPGLFVIPLCPAVSTDTSGGKNVHRFLRSSNETHQSYNHGRRGTGLS